MYNNNNKKEVKNALRFATKNTYVDIETGEILSPQTFKNEYYTVRISRRTKQPNKTSSFRIIELTIIGRRKAKQSELQFS